VVQWAGCLGRREIPRFNLGSQTRVQEWAESSCQRHLDGPDCLITINEYHSGQVRYSQKPGEQDPLSNKPHAGGRERVARKKVA